MIACVSALAQSAFLFCAHKWKNKVRELTFLGDIIAAIWHVLTGFIAGFETFDLKMCFDATLFFIQLI